ncbi:zinc-ribbon domain-containing protein [Candidatus Pelagibacter sp.]|nr:zinc-ribbon domain-containing protein [Candidatus Pelagibacter sp.]
MIIECTNCIKKFRVDDDLIPENGREIICGSCNYAWHFKPEKTNEKSLVPDNEMIDLQKKTDQNDTDFHEDFSNITSEKNLKNDQIKISKETNVDFKIDKKNKYLKTSNFFSYLIVIIISFFALIILVDTIKSPLINIFPGLEIILFNLFETLKDLRLFIIDLT